MHLFEYPITRPVVFSRFWTAWFLIAGLFWVTSVTLLNIATVGYETVPITSTSYNYPYHLWYEKLFPVMSWLPASRSCDPSVIRLLEGSHPDFKLTTGVSTDSKGFFTYFLEGYIDPAPGDTVDGLMYRQTSLTNCSIEGIRFYQPISDYFNFQVGPLVLVNSRLLLSVTQQTNNGLR